MAQETRMAQAEDEIKPYKTTRTFSLSIDTLARFCLRNAGEELGRFDLGMVAAELSGNPHGSTLEITVPEA